MKTTLHLKDSLLASLPDCLLRDRLQAEDSIRRLWPPRNESVVRRKLEALESQLDASKQALLARKERVPSVDFPEALPISARREEIIELIRRESVVVIAGETGSGKTTQIPKMCLAAGLGSAGLIGCTQPRRVAALSVSKRIAEELKVEWGQEVGCQIRFSDKTTDRTFIKMMTDGILLNEIQHDPLLSDYEAIIVDEAHERSLNIDFILGYLHTLRRKRPDLKIIITSATIDTEAFSKAFDDAPIVEVSGRMFPVEVEYRPLDVMREESGDFTYVDAVAQIVDELIHHYPMGDVLVFLPGERDIREVRELLSGRRIPRCDILPLFGRLSAAEQQRIFARSQNRKIILATNIAETSITIPGIRYVIDTGLARVSRYSPHTRTQRLPIESVSQSSANQRKGRCGRVAEGVCFRVYSEDDFLGRDEYSTPEILRSNLAAVILRMIAFRLGDIEAFPFINPPDPRAIRAGYQLLFDLGALNEAKKLTPLGKQLAHIPVDPTVGRMLLQAHEERALKSVSVIAAGLSIQDPRERPLEQQEAADRMHKRFVNEESDFLALLNIWNTYHDECETLSQSKLRKFCKSHFISYLRMREWRDIHQQLVSVLKDLKLFKTFDTEETYDAMHRSILSGLLGNVAQKENINHYRATHGRNVMLFPGSGLFDQKAAKAAQKQQTKKRSGESFDPNVKNKTPQWIVCGEWVETSRLFARMVARIHPDWLREFGEHLIKVNYAEPAWSAKSSRVLVREKCFLYGLEISNKRVGYGKINSADATEIFIRQALLEGDIREQFSFLKKNLALREHVESLQTRMRQGSSYSLDERFYRFYAERIQDVSSSAELRKLLNANGGEAGDYLVMTEADLMGMSGMDCDVEAFPDAIEIDGKAVPLQYHYKPGEEADGVTLKVNLQQFDALQEGVLDWLVPGYIEDRVDGMLRALPKDIRKQLFPIADKTKEIMLALKPTPEPLVNVLSNLVFEKYKVRVRPDQWKQDAVPQHLTPRVEVVSDKQETVVSGRNWEHVRTRFQEKVKEQARQGVGMSRTEMWKQAQRRWEKEDVSTWSFDDLPESVKVGDISGVPVFGYPGLELSEGSVSVRLFQTRADAVRFTPAGYRSLCDWALSREMAWLKKDLNALSKVGPALITLCPLEELKEQAYLSIRNHLFTPRLQWPLTQSDFQKITARASEELKGLVPRFVDRIAAIIEKRQEILTTKQAYPTMGKDLGRLVPKDFMRRTPYEQLVHIPRYLRAMQVRARRAHEAPQKEQDRAARIAPFENQLNALLRDAAKVARNREQVVELFWLMEEFRVATFAQELGTANKVSEKRLKALFSALN